MPVDYSPKKKKNEGEKPPERQRKGESEWVRELSWYKFTDLAHMTTHFLSLSLLVGLVATSVQSALLAPSPPPPFLFLFLFLPFFLTLDLLLASFMFCAALRSARLGCRPTPLDPPGDTEGVLRQAERNRRPLPVAVRDSEFWFSNCDSNCCAVGRHPPWPGRGRRAAGPRPSKRWLGTVESRLGTMVTQGHVRDRVCP